MTWMQYGRATYEIGSHEMPGVRVIDIARSLSHLNRFTGHSYSPYSVAKHSVFVSKLLDVNTWEAMYGLVHDVAETVVNDVGWPVKSAMSNAMREEWKRIDTAAEIALFKVLQVPFPMPPKTYDIVKRADWVAVATEKRDLMFSSDREWDMVPEPPCHHLGVEPTTDPQKDAADWLERYTDLAEALGIRL
jgi:hypothetical protein